MKLKFDILRIKEKLSKENIKKYIREMFQMINLIYKNYSDGETQILACTLTYFSMIAVFPVLALILGITKGFGLDKLFIQKIFDLVPQNEGMVRTVLDIANKLLASTEGSILTGVGVVILINSAIKVLMMLEDSFNKIWRINKNRSITRRVVDYVAIVFLGPILFIVIIATNSFVAEKMSTFFFGGAIIINVFLHILGPLFYIFLFTLLFYIIPNTNVKLKPALISGIITAFLCFILKFAFTWLQSFITRYNAIYGSLALIPIFLTWVQYIWVTILLGGQIAFSIQTSDEFLYNERIEMPIKLKKEAGLLILSLIINRFKQKEEPYTHGELTKKLGMEALFIKDILSELEKMNFVNEVITDKNEEAKYQIAYDPEALSLETFINRFEGKNSDYYGNIFNNLTEEEKELLENIKEKTLFKDKELLKNI
ncbi:MAG: YihY/virulence factor BrkB family protein [Leptotrichiaceae bacterium]|nr:YihY/virulence factor BrkB family protein [Leptotrichiaceae bacterium]